MNLNIKSTNLELTPILKDYIEDKIGSLEKFLKKLEFKKGAEIKAFVEVARSTRHHHKGLVYYAEVDLEFPGGMLRAKDNNSDVRAAIDAVKDKLHQEILKFKETGKTRYSK